MLKREKKSGYIPSLDGWRAVAILWVIAGHSQYWRLGWVSSAWVHANRGVQLFFALSGLLICTRLLREEQRYGGISLRSFYTRRVFRIQPAALTYLGVISVLMLTGAIPQAWSAVAGAALMVRSFLPRTVTNWQTAHFWSLAVEEQFYLLLPGFLAVCRRYRLRVMCVLVVALEIWRVIVFRTPRLRGFAPLIDLRTDMVMGGILLGSVFALALTRAQILAFCKAYLRPWVALLYMVFAFTVIALHHTTAEYAIEISVWPVLLTATMLHPDSWTTRFLELAPVRFVGQISYSLYLWQMLFFDPQDVPAPGSLRSHALLCWVGAFGCAIASYYLIETPLIRRGHRIAKRFDLEELEQHKGVVAAVGNA